MWMQRVKLRSTRCGCQLVVAVGCYCALSGSDWLSVTFSMRSRHSALSIQSMASHWIPSLWRQRHTNTMYLHKYKQLGRHNCSIILRGPDKMSHVQAAGPLYKKTTVWGRNWDDPKPLAVCLFWHEKAQPPPPARAASAVRSRCMHNYLGLGPPTISQAQSMEMFAFQGHSPPVVLQLLQREDVLVEVLLQFLVGVVDVKLFEAVYLQEGTTRFRKNPHKTVYFT